MRSISPATREVLDMSIEVASLKVRLQAAEMRLRVAEKAIDVIWSPWWKRVLFALDGWPWYRLARRRQWRPWH